MDEASLNDVPRQICQCLNIIVYNVPNKIGKAFCIDILQQTNFGGLTFGDM